MKIIYGSGNIRCNRQTFSIFWAIFCPFSTLTTWKIKNLILEKTICTINDNHMMYGPWDKEYDRTDIIFSHSGPFLALLPQKLKNFEKMKKLPGDIFILHRCNINDNHVMHGSWDTKCNRQNFLSFWTIFCLFMPLTTQKIIIWKNEKNT